MEQQLKTTQVKTKTLLRREVTDPEILKRYVKQFKTLIKMKK